MGAAFGLDGSVRWGTPVHGLPLPPPVSGRVEPTFNGNGQYRLPDPETGKITSYTRASTVAKTLEDTWMLDAWSKRMMLIGVWQTPGIVRQLDALIGPCEDNNLAAALRTPLNRMSEEAQHAAGSTRAAEFGTATHAWCEWVDLGLGTVPLVPEMFRPWVLGHRRALAAAGLTVEPSFTERVVLNTQWKIAGTLDRLFRDWQGGLLLGDIKTSKGLDYSWLYFAIQLAIYHGASHVLSEDGTRWEPMPPLDASTALISHLPREDPEHSRIVPIDMTFGHAALHTAMTVRRQRSRADKNAQAVSYAVGSIPAETARRYAARFAVETSRTEAEMASTWEKYQDIWTDDLTGLGQWILALNQLRTAPPHEG